MFQGKGANGKGALLRLIIKLLGKKNVCCVGLNKLVTDRFASSSLVDKAANIGGEVPNRDLTESDVFKAACGEDYINVEQKGVPAFDYYNWAKLLFAANKLSKTPDDTDAFMRRWIIIIFPFVFGPDPGSKHAIDNTLEDRMGADEELSGLLNLAIRGLQRLKDQDWNFSYKLTVQDVKNLYRRLSDPVFAFLMDECVADEKGEMPKQDLHEAYKKYAKKNGLAPFTAKKFNSSVREQDYIAVSEGSKSGNLVEVWRGIQFNKNM